MNAARLSPGFEGGEPGDVPTWAVKPRDDATGDGVAHARKDDRDGPRLPLGALEFVANGAENGGA